MSDIRTAAEVNSLLVIGEPGAGKTGVLVELVQQRLHEGLPTILLSVDDLTGVATADALRVALGLEHSLSDTLAAWPGVERCVLVIDALDASRGGHAEGVFASLIEAGQRDLSGRWSVIASIRTFDLKNSKRLRSAFAGTPPVASHADAGASGMRHFRVPPLSDEELADLAGREPRLGALIGSAPATFKGLLQNIFNLSLAAELLDNGMTGMRLGSITTQSELIERYEDERLVSGEMQAAVANSVRVMVERRRLILRRVDVAHPALDLVLASGMMVANGDRVAFAHHVLFDHAAGRYFLDWNDPTQLKAQLSVGGGIGLMLGPSLRYAIEHIWREDTAGHPSIWNLVTDISTADEMDSVVSSIALRSITERVANPGDIEALCSLLRQNANAEKIGATLSRIARFASMGLTWGRSIFLF
jgi:hypothetical protein